MKSLSRRFASAPSLSGWALFLALFLAAGLLFSACGDEEDDEPDPTPPTTPTPPPPAAAPATPSGLTVASMGADFIEWSWTAVPGATGYQVQFSTDESFTDADPTADRTATQTSYRQGSLGTNSNGYLRVRAFSGSGENRVFSDWSTHVTGTTIVSGSAPTNVRVSDQGADFVEWSWNAVAGATGYQVQYATNATFTAGLQTFIVQGSANTRQAVRNLAAGTTAYVRVRAFTGSIASPAFGAWSASVQGSPDATKTPDPLTAPANVRSTSQGNNSIGLAWNEVTNADAYEVQFRARGASSWSDAECGGGDNEVDDESCLATDLDPGTAYEFRVRAIPADGSTTHANSAWATTASAVSTSGRRPSEPTVGGSGSLNPRWEAVFDDDDGPDGTVTIVWDRVAGATYDWAYVNREYAEGDNPCRGVTFTEMRSPHTALQEDTSVASEPALFCVKTSNPNNASENLSHVWVITPPADYSLSGNGGAMDNDNNGVIETVVWSSGFEVKKGFGYEFRVIEDAVADNDIGENTSAGAVQSACSSGQLVSQDTPDVNLSVNTVSVTNPDPYTGYLLCMRYSNTAGETSWRVAKDNHEYFTAPGAPPTPSLDTARSVNGATGNVTLFWNVATRGASNVPRQHDEYEAKLVTYRDFEANGNNRVRVPVPNAAQVCRAGGSSAKPSNWPSGVRDPWNISEVTSGDLSTTTDGIRIASGDISRPNAGGNPDLDHANYLLCVRTAWDSGQGTLNGPWAISSPTRVTQATQ